MEAFFGCQPGTCKTMLATAEGLYSPDCRELVFSETRLPVLVVLENSEHEMSRGC